MCDLFRALLLVLRVRPLTAKRLTCKSASDSSRGSRYLWHGSDQMLALVQRLFHRIFSEETEHAPSVLEPRWRF